MKIEMSADHLSMVKNILCKRLPHDTSVWVFGSRVKGTAKKYSDLDLAIDMQGSSISLQLLTLLINDFEESMLPYKVDIVDLNSVAPGFRQMIEKNSVLLNLSADE